MHHIRLAGLLSTATVTLAAWAVPAAADATPQSTVVRCGQTLTADTRLANNLVRCPHDGLIIGADNITVDLAGHSITGVNAAGSEGIADDGHRGAHVQHGTIANFFLNGVALRGAPHSVVRGLRIRAIGAGGEEGDASAGVQVKDSPHSAVIGNVVTNHVSAYQSDGVDVLSSAHSTVTGNRLAGNAWNGMVVLSSPCTRVVGNALERNQNQGLELNFGSDGSRVTGNHATGNGSDGLVVGAVSRVRVEANHLARNGDTGLFLFDLHRSQVRLNIARGNQVGIDLEGGQNGSTGNFVVANAAGHNANAGLVVGNGADDNAIVANVAVANHGAPGNGGGVLLVGVTGNTVRANLAAWNRDVGIGVIEDQPGDSTGNVLRGNVAVHNRNHGIVAVAGTVDGGHNIAHGNTPLPNCSGVACS